MMKKIPLILAILFIIPGLVLAQKKVSEKDVIGTWKLVIVINEEDEEDDEDYENREVDGSFLGHVLSSGIKALVYNIIDEIEIEFEFIKDGTLEIYAMGEREDDENKWFINNAGELIIKGDNERDHDDDDIWLLKDGKLQSYEKRGSHLKEKEAYLKRVDN